MIAADTSTWIVFLEGGDGDDVQLLDHALKDRQVLMVPAVLTELLSDPRLRSDVAKTLSEIPLVELRSDFWEKAGLLRAKVLAKRRKARLGDALIAQRAASTRVFRYSLVTETSWYLRKQPASILSFVSRLTTLSSRMTKVDRNPGRSAEFTGSAQP